MNAPKQTPEATSGGEVARKLIDAVERLGRALGSARREVATRYGLSLLGLQLLEALDRRGATAVGELAAELDVRQPTISDAISTLETRGLLTKHRSELDRRTTEVELTAAGATTAGRILEELAPILRPGPDEPAAPLDYRSAPRAQALQVVPRGDPPAPDSRGDHGEQELPELHALCSRRARAIGEVSAAGGRPAAGSAAGALRRTRATRLNRRQFLVAFRYRLTDSVEKTATVATTQMSV
ncbi:MAG: MarR family winged helix-turn-helix transcriptional regulator [Microthrixaceae bacterium]